MVAGFAHGIDQTGLNNRNCIRDGRVKIDWTEDCCSSSQASLVCFLHRSGCGGLVLLATTQRSRSDRVRVWGVMEGQMNRDDSIVVQTKDETMRND